MWPDQISNAGHLALESDALPTTLRGLANTVKDCNLRIITINKLTFAIMLPFEQHHYMFVGT